jgi:hypothetical protein
MKPRPSPKIERDVPFTPYRDNRCSVIVKNMKPGDSVLVESHSKATGYITAGQRRGFRMASRKEGNGVRVWRLADVRQPRKPDDDAAFERQLRQAARPQKQATGPAASPDSGHTHYEREGDK